MDTTANKDAFITLKDHKPNFTNKPTCRLINPTKSEIGKVSKGILDRINSNITNTRNFNQWKNTASVINWFKSSQNHQRSSLICFDIENFYPSISQDLLNKALDFASNYDNITADERNIIIHAKSSILIHKNQPWQKKGNTTFDVTMGSFDGAETCELVGSFLLSQLQHLNINVGLYRDDGLAITNASPRDTENTKKEICRIFNNNGLRITIEANKKIINFLDVTFNLNQNTYPPFTKPNTELQYVHRESNHPPITTKNIPAGINRRLSSLSSDKTSFDQAVPPYQKALDESGYHYTLQYEPPTTNRRKNRQRNNVIWYNPPFSKNTSTNIGYKFLALIDKHFPKDHKLRKIFNRNTIKISYSCMNNAKQIIDNHNKQILKSYTQANDTAAANPNTIQNKKTCNCRQKNTCPLEGNYNHRSSTKLQSHATTTTQQKHTSDSQKTTSKQGTETIQHHSATLNTEAQLN